jgi:plastocyanin
MKCNARVIMAAMAFMLMSAGMAGTAHAAETVVDQVGLKFVPNSIAINAGDSIRFTNSDPFTHDVTVIGPDGSASDKGLQHHGKDNVVVFPTAGKFQIVCKMHPNMKATVIVK